MASTPPVTLPVHLADTRDTNAVVATFDAELADRRQRFSEVTAALFDGDPVRDELLRLRSAEHTRCEYCRNIRKRAAHDAGLREDIVGQVLDGDLDALDDGNNEAMVVAEDYYAERATNVAEAVSALGEEGFAAVALDLVRYSAGGQAMVTLGLEPVDQPLVLV